MTNLLYWLTGFGIGLLVGMTGLGGPWWRIANDAAIDFAVWHSSGDIRWYRLLYSAATKTAGSVVHGLAGSIS